MIKTNYKVEKFLAKAQRNVSLIDTWLTRATISADKPDALQRAVALRGDLRRHGDTVRIIKETRELIE